jgi:RND family efflux transporter MFP subunit
MTVSNEAGSGQRAAGRRKGYRLRSAGSARPRAGVEIVALAALLAAAACGRGDAQQQASPQPQAVRIGSESVARVERQAIKTGPRISGELRPEREAMVRAEVGGSVLEVMVEEARPIRQGAVVARIEAQALTDAEASARSALRSAEQALGVAQREAQRTETLVKGGALADRDLENARNAVVAAQAQVADARSRLASASKQVANTVIRAPLSGIVSERPVNRGDVVAPGAPIVTIIDPTSMMLEASVPSVDLEALRVDAPVEFRVRGYGDQVFSGHIERIGAVADPVTRQVPIWVSIPNSAGRLVAGLFAEGQVNSESRNGLVAPANAVGTTGSDTWVLRVRDGKAERVPVQVGLRDERAARVELTSGVSEGDVLLTGAAHAVTPGARVSLTPESSAARKDQ